MSEGPVLLELGVLAVGATGFLLLGRLLRLPPILSYILAGLALGPAAGLLRVSESLHLFSEIGIALLLFLVGLELSLERIRDIGRTALVVGTVQVAVVTALGALIGSVFGFGRTEAAVLGLVTAFSSTVVVVRLLERTGGLTRSWGRIAIGILLVQDVLVAVALTLLAGLGSGESVSVVRALGLAFGGMVVLVAAATLAVRLGPGRFLARVAESPEALFVVGLTWCFGFILAAEALHLSVELGAFVAGVALAQLPQSRELERRVHPLVSFFLAVFFVALGAGLEPGAVDRIWVPALVLSLFVLLVKPAVILGLVTATGHPARTGFLSGLTMGQVSEFGFVLVGLAAGAGLVGAEVVALTGLVGLITIGVSSVLVPGGPRLADRLSVPLRWRRVEESEAGDEAIPAGHVLVIGMNALGRRIVEGLVERGVRTVALDTDPRKLEGLPAGGRVGDARVPSVLEEAGLARARLVVSALRIEGLNALLAYRCRRMGVPVVIHVIDPETVDELLESGADHLIVSKQDAVFRIVSRLHAALAEG